MRGCGDGRGKGSTKGENVVAGFFRGRGMSREGRGGVGEIKEDGRWCGKLMGRHACKERKVLSTEGLIF